MEVSTVTYYILYFKVGFWYDNLQFFERHRHISHIQRSMPISLHPSIFRDTDSHSLKKTYVIRNSHLRDFRYPSESKLVSLQYLYSCLSSLLPIANAIATSPSIWPVLTTITVVVTPASPLIHQVLCLYYLCSLRVWSLCVWHPSFVWHLEVL